MNQIYGKQTNNATLSIFVAHNKISAISVQHPHEHLVYPDTKLTLSWLGRNGLQLALSLLRRE